MTYLVDPLLVVVLLLNFMALAGSRLRAVIYAVAFQGVVLGSLPLFVHKDVGWRVLLLIVATITVKGLVIPRMLIYAMREVVIRREVEPIVGFIPSLLLGVVGTALALVFARTLPLDIDHRDSLIVPASLATVLTGFVLLSTRRKAISQAVGYLVLENGIFLFGLLLVEALPFLVEVGVLLDLSVGVFVMGIIIHHISREFSSQSTEHLSALKE
jgi:hydrogenase-4 component E